MNRLISATFALALAILPARAADKPHNVVIFVADGLRYDSVTPERAPALYAAKRRGVDFINSHSIYPTITTVNASAIATGHYIGDTGNFGNSLFAGRPDFGKSSTPFLEDDEVLGRMNAEFNGNYLNETALLAAARAAGFATAAVGKTGPTAIQDVTARDGTQTIVIDDSIGKPNGLPVTPDIAKAIAAAGLPPNAPKTAVPNNDQNSYMLTVATKVVLPKLKASGKPFVLVFWSRDPDASQHGTKDSAGKLPLSEKSAARHYGINGPSAVAGVRDANDTFAGLVKALKAEGLEHTTNVFVTADHGFSTIIKSVNRNVRKAAAFETDSGDSIDLPSGFVAIDIANELDLPLFDPNLKRNVDYRAGHHPAFGNGFIGNDPKAPEVIVVANGGSDLIYLSSHNAEARLRQIVDFLTRQIYVSGIFVDDKYGEVPGTLPTSTINYRGSAKTPQPAIIFSFASSALPGCRPLLLCAAEYADTSLKTGQGMHGSFSRADTRNFMAAFGPDFRQGFSDPAPISNADITPTLAELLGLKIEPKGVLTGRVISEALRGGKTPVFTREHLASEPATNGQITRLDRQRAGGRLYFDAAGFPGRTVGLSGP
ncbi:MAG TPA: alkaline phosphatase family protein [Rhizomicrobium sp.]|nr:alkaline phosphatase family protein [Rhizomicrobium sp.]